MDVQPHNVVLTAFKLGQEVWGPGSPVVVRMYESTGQPAEAEIHFPAPLMHLEETNHLEQRVESNAYRWEEDRALIRFKPHEIKSFRFQLAIPAFAIDEGEEHRDDIAPGPLPGFEGG